SSGAECLVSNVSVALRHANSRRRGPPHDARHDRIGDASFEQAGDCGVPKIVEPAPECRLFFLRVTAKDLARSLLGFFPSFLPVANRTGRVGIVDHGPAVKPKAPSTPAPPYFSCGKTKCAG